MKIYKLPRRVYKKDGVNKFLTIELSQDEIFKACRYIKENSFQPGYKIHNFSGVIVATLNKEIMEALDELPEDEPLKQNLYEFERDFCGRKNTN